MEKIIKKNILVIEPIYIKDIGNCTRIYTEKEGSIEIEKTIKTVINNISKYYCFDMKEGKKKYGELLNIKKFPPIAFNPNNIFIYIKMRKPISIHDGAYGYIRYDVIEKIIEKDNIRIIKLKNGEQISTLSSISIINKRINNGKIVKRLSEDNINSILKEDPEFYINKNQLATKSDIALLYMKMLELKEVIE